MTEVTAGPRAASDVLVEDRARRTQFSFADVGFWRPVRIRVHSGSTGVKADAAQLVEALHRALSKLAAGGPYVARTGGLRARCRARRRRYTLNLLVWVGDGNEPRPVEENRVKSWLSLPGERAAIAVVPRGSNIYDAIPQALADRQVIVWDGDPDRAAHDLLDFVAGDGADRRVFISYSHRDGAELALEVNRLLTEARFTTFLDSFDLDPGDDFAERIEHELMEKAFLVLIETPQALESAYVEKELEFAWTQRLGIVAVRHEGSTVGPTTHPVDARWNVPKPQPGGPVLDSTAAAELGTFLVECHTETIAYRRQVLKEDMRAWLLDRGVEPRQISGFPGGLRVDVNGASQYVSLRPRPAHLLDMHAAFRRPPAGDPAAMVSATPRGRPEREALTWLARESPVSHHDEGDLGPLATVLAEGRL